VTVLILGADLDLLIRFTVIISLSKQFTSHNSIGKSLKFVAWIWKSLNDGETKITLD